VLACSYDKDEAIARAKALAESVVADRLERGEVGPEYRDISFKDV
jgi:hypothetical protein